MVYPDWLSGTSLGGRIQPRGLLASALLRDLQDAGILAELTGKQRRRVFSYAEYLLMFPDAGSSG